MSAHIQQKFTQSGFADAATAQDSFARQFDLQEPEQAMTSYQRIMHEHTKQQFEMAAASSRRRSSATETSATSPSSSVSISR